MTHLFDIIVAERRTLLRGMVISFLLIFPCTFLPAIFRSGFLLSTLIERLNDSIFYSFGFSVLIAIASIIHNYYGLMNRNWYLDKPAFKELDFYGRIDGQGSVVYDLETFLLGKIENYFFRLNLIGTDKGKVTLEIIPLIDLIEKQKEIEKLKSAFNFKTDLFFSVRMKLSEINLEDRLGVRVVLANLSKKLKELEFESLDVDENELEMDLRKQ